MEKNKNIFTIGDIVKHKEWNSIGTIKGFRTLKHYILITIDWNIKNNVGDDSEASLKNIEHYIPKKPSFTTEDGVNIFEGDDYYSIHTTQFNFPNGYGKPTIKGTAIKGYWITFSTKEAAEEYVLMNKPCLSIQDLINHTKEKPNIRRISPRGLKAFKNLVKQKLNN